jgi:hypothetical protein
LSVYHGVRAGVVAISMAVGVISTACTSMDSRDVARSLEIEVHASIIDPGSRFAYNVPLEGAEVVAILPDGSRMTVLTDRDGLAVIDLGALADGTRVSVLVSHYLADAPEELEIVFAAGAVVVSTIVNMASFRLDRIETR